MSRTLNITATEPQAAFHALTSKYSLFVGGFGCGKSEAMLNQAILDALQHPDAIIALFEPTHAQLRDILIKRLMDKLRKAELDPKHIKSERRIETKHPQCGTFSLYSYDDPDKISGIEVYTAHVDEIDTIPLDKAIRVWNQVTARARQVLPDCVKNQMNRVSAYSTPEGFNFTYQRWGQGNEDKLYQYVRASTYSNPNLRSDYIEGLLATYPENLCKAYLEGKWVNLTSGQVYDSYNAELHDTSEVVQGDEKLFIGIDFNITKMAATIYVKRKNPNLSSEKKEVWHAVDEIVNAYNTGAVLEILKERYPDNIKIFYPDATGTQRNTATTKAVPKSNIAMIEQDGHQCLRKKTNPLIADRVNAMNAALEKGWVKINYEKCPTVASCLIQQAYDKHGVPDKTKNQDHQNDASSYPIFYNFPIVRPAAYVPVKFSL